MSLYKILCTVFFVSATVQFAWADYLVVSRSATIKEAANRDAHIIERAQKGDTIDLLDDGVQQNGYYHVTGPQSNSDGWIYRTLVRRYPGEIHHSVSIGIITAIDWPTNLPAGYYDGTEDLTGAVLKDSLHNIIDNHTEFPYTSTSTDVWDILKVTDQDPTNSENVVLLYSMRTRNGDLEYNHGHGWTREHVWAKSHGDFSTTKGAGTDAHHLRPVDATVNSSRNNKDFDIGGVEYEDGDFPTGSFGDEDSWEPRDDVKGDVARMIFYMAVRYEGDNEEPDLEVSDGVNTSPNALHGRLSALLEWHDIDPVDNWERRRNDIIYEQFQGNRNPFIDHPEYVRRIWSVD